MLSAATAAMANRHRRDLLALRRFKVLRLYATPPLMSQRTKL
jgi:hypothetical protein